MTFIKASQPAATGTSTFVWHDGKSRYDEVAWDPEQVTSEQAMAIARHKLNTDIRATRVQVEFDGLSMIEFVRG